MNKLFYSQPVQPPSADELQVKSVEAVHSRVSSRMQTRDFMSAQLI